MLTYCWLLVFAPCLLPKVCVVFHVCNSYRADNCSFWWNQSNNLCSLFLLFNIVKKLLLYWFFITRCQCGCCQSMWKEKENIFCQEVDVVKNKNLKEVTVEQLQAEARCIVQHPGLGETGEGWPRLHFFCTKKLLHSTGFLFLHPVVFCLYCNCQHG